MVTIPADILAEFRSPAPGGHIHVGWCRVVQGWRWRMKWDGGGELDWSQAAYQTRVDARDRGMSILTDVEARL